MSFDREEAVAIAAELQRLQDEASALIADATSGRHNAESLTGRLETLKSTIKESAKHETLSRNKRPKTDLEQCFFAPAMRSASANFRMKTTHPPRALPGQPVFMR